VLGDYKEVNGLIFPFSVQSKQVGAPGGGMQITIDKIEVNPDVPASRFDMPKAAPKPADAPAKPAPPADAPKPPQHQ
jgi:hypothetical protein